MARPQDAVPPSNLAVAGSSARAASSTASHGVPWPAADEGSSSLPTRFAARRLGLAEWTSGSSVVVSVTGELDVATTAQLSDALGAALHGDVKGLVCDLTGVSFLGAAGVTTLLVARRQALAGHALFDLVCPQPFPRRVITLLGLDAVFNVYNRLAEAVDAQARRVDQPKLTTAPRAG